MKSDATLTTPRAKRLGLCQGTAGLQGMGPCWWKRRQQTAVLRAWGTWLSITSTQRCPGGTSVNFQREGTPQGTTCCCQG
jgi:hypothetical protein